MKGDSTVYKTLQDQCNDLVACGEDVFGYEEYSSKIDSMKSSVYQHYNKENLNRREMLLLMNTLDRGCILSMCV